ncbi:MAG: PTS sugar transporter subunit IIA [Gemmatimonadota bacterium]
MSDTPARGLIVSHGHLAEGLIDAVRRIAGPAADGLTSISNDGLSPEELGRAIDQAAGEGPAVIFVDLQSGSCGTAAFASSRGHPKRAVICGVNLPIALDFVFHRDLSLEELVPRLLEKGREGIAQLGRPA